jgi:hypothetical protein
LKKWRSEDSKIYYQMVDEDQSTGEWIDLSRPMIKSGVFESLYSLCTLYSRIEKLKWKKWEKLRAEQEREQWLWSGEENDENDDDQGRMFTK